MRPVLSLAAAAAFAISAAPCLAQPSPAVREYRLHMFDPSVSVLANRTAELMFDVRRAPAGPRASPLPRAIRPLAFDYSAGGDTHPASAFAERTFTDALLIIKDGRIVHEAYLNRADAQTHFMSYSMGKSFNAILMGMAIADGAIGSVEEPVTKYLPELKGGAYDGVTLKNLLQMRTGVAWDDSFFADGPARDAHVAAFVDNRIRYVAAAAGMKRGGPPGQAFAYNSIEATMAGEIVARATGRRLTDYLSAKLWKPAGMESYAFYVLDGPPEVGREFSAGALNATLRDYGRVGLMMLNGGVANARRLLPAAWVKAATTAAAGPAREGLGYGYLWWTIEGTSAFTMEGGEGQFVYVDPPSRTVIVKLSHIPVGAAGRAAMAESWAFMKAASAWRPSP